MKTEPELISTSDLFIIEDARQGAVGMRLKLGRVRPRYLDLRSRPDSVSQISRPRHLEVPSQAFLVAILNKRPAGRLASLTLSGLIIAGQPASEGVVR